MDLNGPGHEKGMGMTKGKGETGSDLGLHQRQNEKWSYMDWAVRRKHGHPCIRDEAAARGDHLLECRTAGRCRCVDAC